MTEHYKRLLLNVRLSLSVMAIFGRINRLSQVISSDNPGKHVSSISKGLSDDPVLLEHSFVVGVITLKAIQGAENPHVLD